MAGQPLGRESSVKRDATSPAAYRAAVTGDQSDLLEAIRDVIFQVMPEVEEGIQYGMLDYPGLANLAAQKRYVSLYVPPPVLTRHAAAFAGVDSGKSCLRFRSSQQLETASLRALLEDVAQLRKSQPTGPAKR